MKSFKNMEVLGVVYFFSFLRYLYKNIQSNIQIVKLKFMNNIYNKIEW